MSLISLFSAGMILMSPASWAADLPQAPTAAVNTSCKKAHIEKLIHVDLINFSGKNENLCLLPDSAIPVVFQTVLKDITEDNGKVAALLGISSDQLLPTPLHIALAGDWAGAWTSASVTTFDGEREIRLGLMSDWNGEPIEQGVYIHELTHYLTLFNDNPAIAPSLAALAANDLFRETVADTFALATVGTILADSTLPRCYSFPRLITGIQSYAYPRGYFDMLFSTRRVVQCCDHLLRTGDESSFTKNYCSNTNSKNAIFPPFERGPLTSSNILDEELSDDQVGIDPHQIGIPINAFFLELSRKSGLSVAEIAIRPLLQPKGLDLSGGRIKTQALFNFLRDEFSKKADVTIWDEEWTRHRMDKAIAIGDKFNEQDEQDKDQAAKTAPRLR